MSTGQVGTTLGDSLTLLVRWKWESSFGIFFSQLENVRAAASWKCHLLSIISTNFFPPTQCLDQQLTPENKEHFHQDMANWTPGYREPFLYLVQIFFQDCIAEDVQLRLFHSICNLLESSLSPLKPNGGWWTVTHSGKEIFFCWKSSKTKKQLKTFLPLCWSWGKWTECSRFLREKSQSGLSPSHSPLFPVRHLKDWIFIKNKQKWKVIPHFSLFQR